MELRYYQREAIDKIKWSLREGLEGGDLICLPTGAGKSIVIAFLAKELEQDILILQPSKEILEQNMGKLLQYVDREDVGVYSASMKEKTIKRYTFATIQSIYKKAEDFKHFKLVLVDECHLVNPKNLGSMFTKFLKDIGDPKVIGFTATPYRIFLSYFRIQNEYGGWSLEGANTLKLINRIQPRFWHRIMYNINNHELVEKGYLSPIVYTDHSLISHEDIPLNKSKSEFDMDAFEQKIQNKKQLILQTVTYALGKHKSVLVFCSSVSQAEDLAKEVGIGAVSVSSKTNAKDRDDIISGFKNGSIRVVFNVGVLTTGFDHPSLSCIILARPTRSLALYYQMIGRGVRLAEGKTYCEAIDLTSTVKNMGRIESIRLVKEKMWEIKTDTGNWHNRQLFSFTIMESKPEEQETML